MSQYITHVNDIYILNSITILGNKYIHLLTAAGNTVLRFEFEDYMAATRYAEYSSFHVDSASTNYFMTVSGYSGDAGKDSLSLSLSLSHTHNTYYRRFMAEILPMQRKTLSNQSINHPTYYCSLLKSRYQKNITMQ